MTLPEDAFRAGIVHESTTWLPRWKPLISTRWMTRSFGGSGGLRLPQFKLISKTLAKSANGALVQTSLTRVLNLYLEDDEGFSI
jgi:hypothetical protein